MGRQLDCPGCGVGINAEKNFCAHCGTELATVAANAGGGHCPDCGTDVQARADFCIHCGATLSNYTESQDEQASYEDAIDALDSGTDDSEAVPASLVLAFAGHEVTITDGDTAGQKIRAGLSKAGHPATDVLRIHREHVRFFRESDGFYLLDLGDNPTHLNGRPLSKGDRTPVSPGDELELSGVAKIRIRSP